LSNNTIFKIGGLFNCSVLQSLTLAKNYLSDFGSVEHLGQCSTTLTSIDLADNKITAD
jgi:Leucine-rich repeat (LRR) protein